MVSIATDSSYMVIMGGGGGSASRLFLIGSFSYLQVTISYILEAWTSQKFGHIQPRTAELAALERQYKISIDLLCGKWCLSFFFVVLLLIILEAN